MNIKINSDLGEITIDKDVIARIAGSSAIECYGLVGMVSKSQETRFSKFVKPENLTKGVIVDIIDDEIVIDMYVIVQFATKISVVAENIIQKVKYNVEKQTGLTVARVNINIESVRVK